MNFQFFTGNLTDAPVLRSKEGAATARVTFTLAISDGKDAKGKEKVHFLNFTAFGTFAENLLCLTKGTRLNIQARVDSYPKEVQIDGRDVTLTMTSYIAIDGGPSMKWATVKVNRNDYKPEGALAPVVQKDEPAERPKRSTVVIEDNDDIDETPRRSSRPGRTVRNEGDEPRERTRRVRSSTDD